MEPRIWSMIRHWSFDKDGTLTDVHEYWACVIQARAEALDSHFHEFQVGLPALIRVMGIDPSLRRIVPPGPIGYGSREDVIAAVAQYLEVEHGVPATEVSEAAAALFTELDAHTHSKLKDWVQLIPGTATALKRLRDQGMSLSIVTGDRTELAKESMRILGIDDLFDTIIGGDDMGRQKPHPDGLLLACERVGVEPGLSAYVGDAPNDLRAAQAGQLMPVGVLSGLGETDELEPLANHVGSDVCDLVEHVLGRSIEGGGRG